MFPAFLVTAAIPLAASSIDASVPLTFWNASVAAARALAGSGATAPSRIGAVMAVAPS